MRSFLAGFRNLKSWLRELIKIDASSRKGHHVVLVINDHWWWITSKYRSWRRAQRPGLDGIPGRRVEAGDRPVLQGGRKKEQDQERKWLKSKISSGLGDSPAPAASPWQAGDERFQGGKHQIYPIFNLLYIVFLQLQLICISHVFLCVIFLQPTKMNVTRRNLPRSSRPLALDKLLRWPFTKL